MFSISPLELTIIVAIGLSASVILAILFRVSEWLLWILIFTDILWFLGAFFIYLKPILERMVLSIP